MRKIILTLIITSALCNGVIVNAAENESKIRSSIASLFNNANVDGINKTQIPGLYEVRVGKNILYSNEEGSYLILSGHLIDVKKKTDITKARLETITKIDWATLPLEKAVVSGDPNGNLKMAIFTDPECPYCRKFEKELGKMKGVKIYSFLFPLPFHKEAKKWSSAIWCAKDKHKMLEDIMLHGANPPAGTCITPIEDIIKLGAKLGINGTPSIISGDGRIMSGAKDAKSMNMWLLSGIKK